MTSVSSRRTRRPQWPRLRSIRGSWWISLTGCCRYLFQLFFFVKTFLFFSCIKLHCTKQQASWKYLALSFLVFIPFCSSGSFMSYSSSSFSWQVLIKQEIQRKSGYAIQVDEEHLRVQLDTIQSELNAPTQFKVSVSRLSPTREFLPHFLIGWKQSQDFWNEAEMGSAHVAILISTLFSKGGTALWYGRIYLASYGRVCLESLVLITVESLLSKGPIKDIIFLLSLTECTMSIIKQQYGISDTVFYWAICKPAY